MRFVIWLILLFVVAAVSATVLGGNDGLVTLYLPPRMRMYWNCQRVKLT